MGRGVRAAAVMGQLRAAVLAVRVPRSADERARGQVVDLRGVPPGREGRPAGGRRPAAAVWAERPVDPV
jgi:hypothetical protein